MTWEQLWTYRGIYNADKHDFTHQMGTHLFSVQDAVLAYLTARPWANSSTRSPGWRRIRGLSRDAFVLPGVLECRLGATTQALAGASRAHALPQSLAKGAARPRNSG